jgi:TonB family protein
MALHLFKALLFSIAIILISYTCNAQETLMPGELNSIITEGRGKNKRKLDYTFKVDYAQDTCINGLGKLLKNPFTDSSAIDYIAPKLANNNARFTRFINDEISYPNYAMEKGIAGKVIVHFEITSTGEVKNIWITKGVHISLDKEAQRLIRKLKRVTPAVYKGVAVELCLDIPIIFEMSEK